MKSKLFKMMALARAMNASRANAAGVMAPVRGAAWRQRLPGCVGISVAKNF